VVKIIKGWNFTRRKWYGRESLPDIYTWKQKINHKRMVWVSVLGLLLKTLEHCYTSQINKFRLLFALNSENLQNNYFTLEGLTSFSPAFQQILAKNNFKFIYTRLNYFYFCTYSSSSVVKILNSIGKDIIFICRGLNSYFWHLIYPLEE
jgi:hypothetical protein